MAFFDPKEDVLEIELTQHGKYLLSLGKFQPIYYSFFDDDIIYDSDHGGYPEEQNSAEGRIKENPRTRCQTSFVDAEVRQRNIYEYDQRLLQIHVEKQHSLTSELGITDYYSDNVPSWDIDILKGELTGSALNYTGSGPAYRIPQVEMRKAEYERRAGTIVVGRYPVPLFDEDKREVREFETDYIEVREDFILLEINENNSTFQSENFDIELFEFVGAGPGGTELRGETRVEGLKPLKFDGPRPPRFKGTSEYVDYYFNITVDMEIDHGVLCEYKGIDSTKGLYLPNIFGCNEETGQAPSDQYKTAIDNIGEVC